MAIVIGEDGEIIIVEGDTQTVINDTAIEINEVPVTVATPQNSIEQIIVLDSPGSKQTTSTGVEIIIQGVADSVIDGMFIVDHSNLKNLGSDDHPHYLTPDRGDNRYTPISHIGGGNNPHGLDAINLPGLSPWGLRVSPVDLAFINQYMLDDTLESTKIKYLVAGKIAAGVMAARIVLGDVFSANRHGSVLSEDPSNLSLSDERIEMGFVSEVDEQGTPTTYMLRHRNGYPANNPNYKSNFSITADGIVNIRGSLTITGGSGIGNFDDAGRLATRDRVSYYQTTPPLSSDASPPMLGDLWYDTDNGNTPYRFNGVTWDSVQDSDIAIAQGSADRKIQAYYVANTPTVNGDGDPLSSADNGDLWFEIDNGNRVRYYDHSQPSGSRWVDAQDSDIASAINDAATAQSTADGKITTYTGSDYPTVVEGLGDLYYNITSKILYRVIRYPIQLVYTPLDWETVGNGFDRTSLLSDDANLGGTADWSSVRDDGGRPADYADVTNIGGANYVLRGLLPPNTFSPGITDTVIGAGNWGFILPDSTLSTFVMTFSIPLLYTFEDYILSFRSISPNGTATFTAGLNGSLPQKAFTATTTGKFHTFVINSADIAMNTSDLLFYKSTSETGKTNPITIFDVKLEYGSQATDWTPFNPATDLADSTQGALEKTITIGDGGIVFDNGGVIRSFNKTTFGSSAAGVYLGWSSSQADYVIDIGDASSYLRWNGSSLTIKGNINLGSGNNLSGGQTDYAVGTGFFLGYSGGTYKVSVSEGTTKGLFWDGANLTVKGTINVLNPTGVRSDINVADGADVTDYNDTGISNNILENSVTTVSAPLGARYSSAASSITGAIVVVLPQSWTSTMIKMDIDIYSYDASNSFTLTVGGQNHNSGSWFNEYAQLKGSITSNNRVRFGHNGSKNVVVIGDTTSTWAYLKIAVRNVQVGYDNFAISQWASGWTVLTTSSVAGYTFSGDFSDALLDARSISNQGNLATQDDVDYTLVVGSKPPSDADNTQGELQSGTTITGGGVILSGGGSIKTINKNSYNDTTPGIFLGWSGSDYTLGIGHGNSYMQWNGSYLSVKTGDTTVQGIDINVGNSNEIVFYAKAVTGSADPAIPMATIGVTPYESDYVVIDVGDLTSSAVGVYAKSQINIALRGTSIEQSGLRADSTNGTAVVANSGAGGGIFAQCSSYTQGNHPVYAYSYGSASAVRADGATIGVFASSRGTDSTPLYSRTYAVGGWGVHSESTGDPSAGRPGIGVYGISSGIGACYAGYFHRSISGGFAVFGYGISHGIVGQCDEIAAGGQGSLTARTRTGANYTVTHVAEIGTIIPGWKVIGINDTQGVYINTNGSNSWIFLAAS